MTALEIIEETVAYYSEDTTRRAVTSDGSCLYTTASGNHCALGRCLQEEFQTTKFKYNGECGSYVLDDKMGLENILRDEYKGHDKRLWSDLQELHDVRDNWNDNGLTAIGDYMVSELKEKYADN